LGILKIFYDLIVFLLTVQQQDGIMPGRSGVENALSVRLCDAYFLRRGAVVDKFALERAFFKVLGKYSGPVVPV
jgi:hypothetical protein